MAGVFQDAADLARDGGTRLRDEELPCGLIARRHASRHYHFLTAVLIAYNRSGHNNG
jgi:hypothetical protein